MKLHLILIFLISYTLCLSQSQMAETIYFEVDSYDVTATERSHIDDILEQIKEYDVKKIHLVGHTDSDGSLAYNRKLSERRVQAVREAFVTNGFDSTLIVTKYEGELDPISQNDSDTGKQKNRRVEVLIQYEATTNALANDKDGRIDEGAEAQVFKFSASKGIEFTGKHGTKIRVKPNSLVDSQGREIDGDLLITLKEYYLRCEMMVAGLQTMSNRNVLLETAGMIHVEITLDGTKVELKKREVIDIEMPNEKRLPPMHVFLKEENETTWGPDPTRDWGFFDEDEVLKKFALVSPRLGWINCDRFVKYDNLVDMEVLLSDAKDTKVCMIFKSINSILNSTKEKGRIKFENIPDGEEVSIIAFKPVGEDYKYAQKDVSIKKGKRYSLKLKKVRGELFEKLIRQFN